MRDSLLRAFAKIEKVNDNGQAQVTDLNTGINNVINAVTGVLSIICVAVIIIGGINYMTSAGDPGKVKKAKDTILYGLVGLAICALAYAIVNFFIANFLETK